MIHYLDQCCPNSKIHGANMGPIWGRQDPGGPHVGPMDFAIWVCSMMPYGIPGPQCVNRATWFQYPWHRWTMQMGSLTHPKVIGCVDLPSPACFHNPWLLSKSHIYYRFIDMMLVSSFFLCFKQKYDFLEAFAYYHVFFPYHKLSGSFTMPTIVI